MKNIKVCFFSKSLFFIAFSLFIQIQVFSLDYFKDGTKAFQNNQPEQAAPLFLKATETAGSDLRSWIFLGLCYQQMGRLDDAVSVYRKGIGIPGTDKKTLYFNLGNVYFIQGKNTFAEEMFSQSISQDMFFAVAYLNRGNTRINLNKLDDAASDYETYLNYEPNSSQKDSILRVLALIREQQASERMEAERIVAEEAERRKAQEEALLAEEARRKKLLEEVENSLKMTAEETTALSAGAEGVVGYDEESELE